MPNNNIDAEIRNRIESFLSEVTDLVRQAALEAVREALGAEAPRKAPTRKKKAARKARRKAGRRTRRSSADLESATATLLAHVQTNPGQRLEQIASDLGQASKDLKRPVQMLMADGKLRTEGQRRGTKYFAGGKRKAGRKKAVRRKGKKKTTRRKATRRAGKKAAKKAA